jgi:heterodisulfide reductase subunit A
LHTDEDFEREFELSVASIVVATGFEIFDAQKKKALRYMKIPDVITSLEFERLICASGPTGGIPRRLSDGEKPKSIVFVQCVGSRDLTVDRPYCSCVCCMYAIKNAILLKEKNKDLDISMLYMDIRAYGKGYEEYYQRAQDLGIKFIRGIPGEILEGENRQIEIVVENTETRELLKLNPELVVLSVGMEPAKGSDEIAAALKIPKDDSGFFGQEDMKTNPVGTIKPGIYVAGAAVSPKDIPDSVMQGGAAAMKAFSDAIRVQ